MLSLLILKNYNFCDHGNTHKLTFRHPSTGWYKVLGMLFYVSLDLDMKIHFAKIHIFFCLFF